MISELELFFVPISCLFPHLEPLLFQTTYSEKLRTPYLSGKEEHHSKFHSEFKWPKCPIVLKSFWIRVSIRLSPEFKIRFQIQFQLTMETKKKRVSGLINFRWEKWKHQRMGVPLAYRVVKHCQNIFDTDKQKNHGHL